MIQLPCLFLVFLSLELSTTTTAWISLAPRRRRSPVSLSRRQPLQHRPSHLQSSNDNGAALEEEINQGLRKARALLEKSKAKLAAREEPAAAVPFFAQPLPASPKISRAGVVKAVDPVSGLIQADGEKMAEISEMEAWEFRSLVEVFNENEMTEEEDRYSLASQQLAKRDVAESIFQLRKELQTEDYRKIFDTKNRFIGEDN